MEKKQDLHKPTGKLSIMLKRCRIGLLHPKNKYIGQGKTESYATELQNIQTAVGAMLHDSSAGQLDSAQIDIQDMDLVTADSGALVLSNYLKILSEDGMVLTGCDYSFTVNGTATQKTP